MRRPVLIGLITALVAAGLLAYALTSGRNGSRIATGPSPRAYRGSTPPAGLRLPAFSLRDDRGHVVRSGALRGKVVVLTFLDTDCKTKCPLIASAVGDGLRLLSSDDRRQVMPLVLTVNPASDTPTSVRKFLRDRHALGLDFLIGTSRQMRPVWRTFHIVAAAETGNADVHSADVRIFNRRGEWVSTLHLPPDLTAKNLAHDIRVALRGG